MKLWPLLFVASVAQADVFYDKNGSVLLFQERNGNIVNYLNQNGSYAGSKVETFTVERQETLPFNNLERSKNDNVYYRGQNQSGGSRAYSIYGDDEAE